MFFCNRTHQFHSGIFKGGFSLSKINTISIVNNSKMNKFHVGLLIWCCFIIAFDGYDLVVYGSVLPILIKEWSLSPIEAGAIGSYGLFGMMLGAIAFGILADKFGRKKVIISSIVIFSICTAVCGFAATPLIFSILRFFAGLGLGGVMPNVIALLTDYAPANARNLMVSIVLCGYSVGGMLAPALSIKLIPTIGWGSVFWVAALPIVFVPLMLKYLPDSTNFLLEKGRLTELRKVLSKINPQINLNENTQFEEIKTKEPGMPIVSLFKNNLALSTIAIWVAYFMCLLMVYGLNTWLPNLMNKAGYPLGSSLTFLIILNLGAIIGTVIIGKLSDKWGTKKMLIPMYILGAICLTLLGFKTNMFVLSLLVGITGACTIGAQNIANSFVSQYHPPFIRSTALGVASGIGRIGAMVGPTMGGVLISLNLPIQMNFISFAIPGVIAAVAFSFIPLKYAYYNRINNKADIETLKYEKAVE
jgi:AAHS family benzoate transporter-like MFS transporter